MKKSFAESDSPIGGAGASRIRIANERRIVLCIVTRTIPKKK